MKKQQNGGIGVDELTAAYLASERRMTQEGIANTLGVSQSAVSRMLAKAKVFIEAPPVRLRFREELVDPETLAAIHQRLSREGVANHLNRLAQAGGAPRGPLVQLFQVPETVADPATRFTLFTRQAAPYVRSLLIRENVRTCGVTWGYMLWDLVTALRSLRSPRPWRSRAIQFVPLSGDPIQDLKGDAPRFSSPSLTSSNIAAELGKIANDDEYHPPWLGLVPAYIPGNFSGEEIKVIERMIKMVEAYADIFGTEHKPGIADNLDVILTSVGPSSSPLGFGSGRLLASLGERKLEQLKNEIFGDIGGVIIPKVENTKTALIRDITRRWKGVEQHHLEACARRSFAENSMTGPPGPVVLALGASRAEVIYHAVSRGLISHLIIDAELEQALASLCSAAGIGKP